MGNGKPQEKAAVTPPSRDGARPGFDSLARLVQPSAQGLCRGLPVRLHSKAEKLKSGKRGECGTDTPSFTSLPFVDPLQRKAFTEDREGSEGTIRNPMGGQTLEC